MFNGLLSLRISEIVEEQVVTKLTHLHLAGPKPTVETPCVEWVRVFLSLQQTYVVSSSCRVLSRTVGVAALSHYAPCAGLLLVALLVLSTFRSGQADPLVGAFCHLYKLCTLVRPISSSQSSTLVFLFGVLPTYPGRSTLVKTLAAPLQMPTIS